MESYATIKLKIPVRDELLETMKQYSFAVQEVLNYGFEMHTHDKRELHDLTYYYIRKHTKLSAQLVCSSRDVACGILKRYDSAEKPVCKRYMTIRYDARSFSFKADQVSLSSVCGRVKMPIEVPDYFKKYLSWKVRSANLMFDLKKRLFLHVTFSKDIDVKGSSHRVVGIDLGINKLAVTSDCQFFNNRRVKKRKTEFRYLRRRLQAKGTRSAKRKLRKLSGREKRFMRQVNHEVSKAIIGKLKAGDTIAIEDLSGIREQRKGRKLNRWLHNWSFFQFQQFLVYKAQRAGINVARVAANNTSKRCSKCGSLNSSRHYGFFECLHCNFTYDADLNASLNIVQRYMRNTDKVLVNEPIVTNDDAEAFSNELKQSSVTSHLTC